MIIHLRFRAHWRDGGETVHDLPIPVTTDIGHDLLRLQGESKYATNKAASVPDLSMVLEMLSIFAGAEFRFLSVEPPILGEIFTDDYLVRFPSLERMEDEKREAVEAMMLRDAEHEYERLLTIRNEHTQEDDCHLGEVWGYKK